MNLTVKALREDLQQLLSTYLGTYTLANGVSTPAVAVRSDSEGLPVGTKVQGLELVINRHEEISPVLQYLRADTATSWQVWLLAWSDDAKITKAAEEVVFRYPGTTAQVITLPEGWGPRRQVQLLITNPRDFELPPLDVDAGDFVAGQSRVKVSSILDAGNFFDGSCLNTYTGTADGGRFS